MKSSVSDFIIYKTSTGMKTLSEMLSESSVPGIGMSEEEAVSFIRCDIENVLADCDIDIDIEEVWLHGSRMRGTHRPTSDLDAVLFYSGSFREDSLFNILHDTDVFDVSLNGIAVDVNPVRVRSAADIDRYKRKSREYDKKKTHTI